MSAPDVFPDDYVFKVNRANYSPAEIVAFLIDEFEYLIGMSPAWA